MIGLRARARRALERARAVLDMLLDDARIAEEAGDLEPPRPRVGPWVESGPGWFARFDDHGQSVAGVGPIFDPRGHGRYSWCAHVPFRPAVTDDAPSKAEAMRRADAVLATWADVREAS